MLECGQLGKVPVHHMFELTYDTINGDVITVYQTRSLSSTGTWAYEAALVLAKFVESEEFHCRFDAILKGKTFIELGAGTGIVGLVAASHGARATITDLETLVPLIEHNIRQNDVTLNGHAIAKAFCWGDDIDQTLLPESGHFDYVILANCIYYEGVLEQLARSVDELSGNDTVVLASYEDRTPEVTVLINRWHRLIERHGFKVEDIDWSTDKQSDYVRLAAYTRTQSRYNHNGHVINHNHDIRGNIDYIGSHSNNGKSDTLISNNYQLNSNIDTGHDTFSKDNNLGNYDNHDNLGLNDNLGNQNSIGNDDKHDNHDNPELQ